MKIKKLSLILIAFFLLFTSCASITDHFPITRSTARKMISDELSIYATKAEVKALNEKFFGLANQQGGYLTRDQTIELIQSLIATIPGTGGGQLAVILKLLEESEANKIRAFTAINGGGTGAMDAIACGSLDNNDLALAYDTTTQVNYFYWWDDDDNTTSEAPPWFIYPDDRASCSNTGVWHAMTGFGFGPTSQPKLVFRDLEATDFDDNAYIGINASQVGSGAEDVDFWVYTQQAGTSFQWALLDADIGWQFFVDTRALSTGDADNVWAGWTTTVIAGEALTQWDTVYIKYSATSPAGPQAFAYDANSTDSDNDTYPPVGVAVSAAASQGDAFSMGWGNGVARHDAWQTSLSLTHNQDEGKPVYCSEAGDGELELAAPGDSGDHVIRIGLIREIDSSDNGTFIIFNFGFADVVVP